jgi:hypothetical protein
MATLAICAVTAALLRRRTDTRAPAPARPDQPSPANPGMIPLTIPETGRLLAHPPPAGAAGHWPDWRRRHQALAAWYHQRTRLARHVTIAQVSQRGFASDRRVWWFWPHGADCGIILRPWMLRVKADRPLSRRW